MKFNNVENKCHLVDGKDVWESRSVAVVGMILMLHEGEIYVVIGRRGPACPDEVGKYCLPCGSLDRDETCEEAVVREVFEESGFNCYKAMDHYNVLHDQMHFPWKINSIPDNKIQNVSLHYALYMDSKPTVYRDIAALPELTFEHNPVLGEVDDIRWVKVSDIYNYDMAFNHESTIRVFVSSLIIEE